MRSFKFQVFPERFGFFPFIFTVYLLMPIYYVHQTSGWKMAFGYGLILLFAVTYRQLYWTMDRKSYSIWLAVQMGIIVLMSLFYGLYHVFMGFFPAHFIGWYKEKKSFYLALGAFFLVIAVPLAFSLNQIEASDLFFTFPFIVIMLMSPFGIRSMNSRMELEQKLEEANEHIKQLVKREERMRIARDLHDTLGHTLSLITLKSQLIGKLAVKDPDRAVMEAKEIENTSRAALKQVRELVSDMRALKLNDAIHEARSILEAAGIRFYFDGDTRYTNISDLNQNILSLCIKEAVTNVVKHSGASQCGIRIRCDSSELHITVHDNGRWSKNSSAQQGNGLKGISERLSLIEGFAEVTHQDGTFVRMTAPVIVRQSQEGVI
ncbi:sensor histidine kinase [Marinicrinis lubricantis]|uniref:histidine kinase n=1 Tax=Marinicrinis lubricantis TaxID=2086470 RepID=A0ABW1ILJ4_9BACL